MAIVIVREMYWVTDEESEGTYDNSHNIVSSKTAGINTTNGIVEPDNSPKLLPPKTLDKDPAGKDTDPNKAMKQLGEVLDQGKPILDSLASYIDSAYGEKTLGNAVISAISGGVTGLAKGGIPGAIIGAVAAGLKALTDIHLEEEKIFSAVRNSLVEQVAAAQKTILDASKNAAVQKYGASEDTDTYYYWEQKHRELETERYENIGDAYYATRVDSMKEDYDWLEGEGGEAWEQAQRWAAEGEAAKDNRQSELRRGIASAVLLGNSDEDLDLLGLNDDQIARTQSLRTQYENTANKIEDLENSGESEEELALLKIQMKGILSQLEIETSAILAGDSLNLQDHNVSVGVYDYATDALNASHDLVDQYKDITIAQNKSSGLTGLIAYEDLEVEYISAEQAAEKMESAKSFVESFNIMSFLFGNNTPDSYLPMNDHPPYGAEYVPLSEAYTDNTVNVTIGGNDFSFVEKIDPNQVAATLAEQIMQMLVVQGITVGNGR